MKRKVLSLIALIFCGLGCMAATVSPDVSRRAAANFWNTYRPVEVKAVTPEAMQQMTVASLPMLHIWAVGQEGFVIMSASDRVAPVLAYSFNSPATREPNPEVMFWLRQYNTQIEAIESGEWNVEGDNGEEEWNRLLTSTVPPMPVSIISVPQMMTTRWDQGIPYNDYCPYDSVQNARTVVGCVATAMAQIMKYWNHPSSGVGSRSYEHHGWGHESSYGTLEADFEGTTYMWDYMRDFLDPYMADQRATRAIATLSYHCGVAVEMMYGTSAGGGSAAYTDCGSWTNACAVSAFREHFKYSPHLGSVNRDTNLISDSIWCDMIDSSLAHGIPLYYHGSDNTGGHAFVLDGADTMGRYHFNWGWSGSYDGFYGINDLAPRSGGVGGNATYTFNNKQGAIFGIVPVEEVFDSVVMYDTVCNNELRYRFHDYEFPAADSTYTAVYCGTVYTIHVSVIHARRLYVNRNGGQGTNYDLQFCPTTGIDAPECTFHNDGYNFIGWATKRTGYDTLYQPGDHLNLRVSTTVYAIWQDTAAASEPEDTVGISMVDGGMIMITPNPTRDIVSLTVDEDEPVEISIVDTWGRVLVQRSDVRREAKISLAALPAGAYTVVVRSQDTVYKRRIIKM